MDCLAGPDYSQAVFPGGYRPADDAGDCWFDHDTAALAVGFFTRYLVHIKGELAGKPMTLERWQADIIATLFGWKKPDGTRRYRTAYIEIPRKNGKSTLAAGIALLLLYLDDEPGAEIYSAAADREQAAIVFELAKENVLRNPVLARRSRTYMKSITHVDPTNGQLRGAYKTVSADAHTKHGFNPSGIIADELHAHPNRDLWDVLNTGTGARTQPLTVAITTAGFDRHSICWEQHEYAEKVRDGIINDQTFLPVIYAAAFDDDWTDPRTWEKANPNIDISVSREFLTQQCEKAKNSAAFENTFRRLYLNQWTEQDVRWLQMEKWDALSNPLYSLMRREAFTGLDLASTSDLTAWVLLFPEDDGTYDVKPMFWVPEDSARQRSRRDRVPYTEWIKQEFILPTPGDVTDFDRVRADINELANEYIVREIAVDRLFQGAQLSAQLMADGFDVQTFGQGFMSMAAPTAELDRLIGGGRLRHAGNPVLRWMASNVAVEMDAAGNLKPSKKRSTEKIDGIVALVMALGRALVMLPQPTGSFYDNNELETF